MTPRIDELIVKIKELEEEMEIEFQRKREDLLTSIDRKRFRLSEEVALQQRRFKQGVVHFLIEARLLNILTAPLIYSGFLVFVLLDLLIFVYQGICFPVYGIPKAKRSDYLVFDRVDLPYLNAIEKFNCFYCSYANGLAAYFREVAARTEQYWCPIKHARRIMAAHDRYPRFFEYGDGESYRKGLERLRKEYEKQGI